MENVPVIADTNNNQQSQESEQGNDESQYLTIEDGLEATFADEGANTLFEVTVKSHPLATCTWYKEGTIIQTNQRIQITSFKKQNLDVFKLEIRNVRVEDTGIYSVLFQNNSHQVSSQASLLVTNIQETNGTIYYPSQETTHNKVVLEPKNVHVNQGDNIELDATFENQVEDIKWYKNNTEISEDFKTIILKSPTNSVLTILKSAFHDSGTYYVVGRSCSGRIISSFTYVYVLPNANGTSSSINETNDQKEDNVSDKISYHASKTYTVIPQQQSYASVSPAECNELLSPQSVDSRRGITATSNSGEEGSASVVRPLESAVASFGSSVTFDCSFALEDGTFYYVIWYIGRYGVLRTNSQFCVLNTGGDFFLCIKRLEPYMAGEVVCQLWAGLPCDPGQSKLVKSTTGYLAIAPRCIVQGEIAANPALKTRKLFLAKPGDGTLNIECGTRNMPKLNENSLQNDEIEVEITLCRLNDKGLFYLYSSMEINATIECRDGDPRKLCITVDKANLPVNHWYAVDMAQSDGSYVEVGVTSEPCVGMEEPPPMTAVKIRMRPIVPADDAHSESSLFINMGPQEDVRPLKCEEESPEKLRSINHYQTEYKTTGERLGSLAQGVGCYGGVALVQDSRGKFYAAKKMRTPCQTSRDKAKAEYDIMKKIKHPKVIHLVEGFKDKHNFIIVMEYLWGGELFDRVVHDEYIQEADVVSYVRQICEALAYIHKQKIVHLDIKPENIVCQSPNSCQIKIIDFGIAKVLKDNQETRTLAGTHDYIPPEILNFDKITTACDMWSLGVATYILLSGLTPFYCESWREMSAKITKAEYGYEDEAFDHVSCLSRDFVDQLLVLNPSDRLTAEQALQHSWLKYDPPTGVTKRTMQRTRENLKTYLYRYKWQRARNVIFAANRMMHSASRHSSTSK